MESKPIRCVDRCASQLVLPGFVARIPEGGAHRFVDGGGAGGF